MSVSGTARPRSLYAGAGSPLQFPLDQTPPHASEPAAAAEALAGRLQDAYLVAPAAHIGRVVTGVIFVAEQSRVSREFGGNGNGGGAAELFGLTTISFADKLAEQGYKVLVLDLFQDGAKAAPTEAATTEQVLILQQAALYLKQQHAVQRVGLCGVGAGADLAIKVAMEQAVAVDCVAAMCPEGRVPWSKPEAAATEPAVDAAAPDVMTPSILPLLLQLGERSSYAASEAYQKLLATCAADGRAALALKASLFVNQRSGFAFSHITDEDAATQALAELLDWLVRHLHRFRLAAGTSDADPWWPQGRNGPFLNVGLHTWQQARSSWLTPTQARPPRPPPVPTHLLFDGLSSVRRTFDLPQRMRLGDVIELFAEIWEVQQ